MKKTSPLKSRFTRSYGAVLALACGVGVQAEDWPRWGGNDPGRNMYSSATGLPDHFEPGKPKGAGEQIDLSTAKNVKWAAKLGSQAYGNVVVAGGKVFIGTNNEYPRDPQHQGDRSILLCLSEKTGDFLWQLVVPKLASGKVNDWENLGLLSSPCVEGNRVYVVTSRCEVLCLDTEGMANGNEGPFQEEAQYVAGPGKPKASTFSARPTKCPSSSVGSHRRSLAGNSFSLRFPRVFPSGNRAALSNRCVRRSRRSWASLSHNCRTNRA